MSDSINDMKAISDLTVLNELIEKAKLVRAKWDQEARLAWLREKVALAYGEYELVDTTVSENHESKR